MGSTGQDYSNSQLVNFWQSNNPTSPGFGNANSLAFSNYSTIGQQLYNATTNKLTNQFQSTSFRSDTDQLSLVPHTGNSTTSMLTNNSSGTSATTTSMTNKYTKKNVTSSSSSSLMNINAPSYVPNIYATTNYGSNVTTTNTIPTNSNNNNNNNNNPNTIDKYKYHYNNNNGSNAMSNRKMLETEFVPHDSLQEENNKLKVELILKNQIIKNLTDQVNLMNKQKTSVQDANHNGTFKAPKNHFQLFQDLSKTLQEKSSELEETKERLEAVLVALACDGMTGAPSSAVSSLIGSGYTYDVEELAHKLINKLSVLLQENENLLRMISFGNKTSLLIEIGLLTHEIEVLKEQKSL